MILADVMKRWAQLQGRNAILCTGTDEHGMKIQQAADRADFDPKTFCDRGADVFKHLASRVNLSHDHFVRTTEPAHRQAVEYAWHLLEERGYIYESKHEGWYSVSDEAFYPQSQIHTILEPQTGRKIMASIETGKEVQWTSERNYHFRLSAFREQLLQYYKENPEWITPPSRMREVVTSVEAGLENLSISRPVDRLTWGIRVPTDSSQTIYVWLDALVNYITKAGYPWQPGTEQDGGWPADVQVIGKDIVRFHCIYWPAFLMALDLPLPKRIMTHAHWTLGKQKMAKSTGNVVNPFFALDRFGVDPMRYFLVHNGGLINDADYDNAFIVERYNTDLKNGLGNLCSRIMRGKGWNVRAAIERYQEPEIVKKDCLELEESRKLSLDASSGPHASVNGSLSQYHDLLATLSSDVQQSMEAGEPNRALEKIRTQIYAANGFVQAQAPWNVSKKLYRKLVDVPAQETAMLERELDCIVYLSMESLRIFGILLQPFIPDKAGELLDMVGVAEDRRSFEHATVGADASYGIPTLRKGQKLGELFMPLVDDM